jgi:hypothetical protein
VLEGVESRGKEGEGRRVGWRCACESRLLKATPTLTSILLYPPFDHAPTRLKKKWKERSPEAAAIVWTVWWRLLISGWVMQWKEAGEGRVAG